MLDLFSGIGGFSLAASWAGGIETVAFCEIEPYCQKVLQKHWPDIEIYSDIKELRGDEIVAKHRAVDIVCGGFPCQPFSCAGKLRGKEDDRYLWPEMLRVIQETKPTWVIGENVANFVNMGLDDCVLDLESEGYEVQPIIIPACAINAPHRRDRVWIVAYSQGRDDRRIPGKIQKQDEQQTKKRPQTWSAELGGASQTVTDTPSILPQRLRDRQGQEQPWRGSWWSIEPNVGRVAYGIPSRVDRLRGLGNAIVPQVAQEIFKAIVDIEARRRYTR